MWRWHRKLVERDGAQGLALAIAINVSIWLVAAALVTYGHKLFFRLGWMHSTSSFDAQEFVVAILTGCTIGLYDWAERDKKRQLEARKRTGLDATMT